MRHVHKLRGIIAARAKRSALYAVPVNDLIARVARLWDDDDPLGVLHRLGNVEMTREQRRGLATSALTFCDEIDQLPSRYRGRADRYLKWLVLILPDDVATQIVDAALSHTRRSRRDVAYKWLRARPTVSDLATRLLRAHFENGDEEPLLRIAHDSAAIQKVDIATLLGALKEEYWRARVFEILLTSDRDVAVSFADRFPIEFVHAVGRHCDASLQGHIDALYDAYHGDAEFACIYVWALEKLGNESRLDKVLGELDAVYPSDPWGELMGSLSAPK